MKRMMTVVAAFAMAFAANAASFAWDSYLGGDTFDGMTWYVVNGTGVDSMVNLLAVDGDVAGFQSAIAATDHQTGVFEAGWEGYAEGGFSSAADYAFMIVLGNTDAGSTFYYTAEIGTGDAQYVPPAPQPGTVGFYEVSSSTIASSAAPEPTSGLLLLLGMAGLALKRKQA